MRAAAFEAGTTLIFVRHGESITNAANRIGGQEDARLTPRGREQAQRVAEFLVTRERVDLVVTSDLTRAAQTAAIIAERRSLPLEIETGLRELDVGELAGLTLEEARSRFPRALSALVRADAEFNAHGGERLADFNHRVEKALSRIAQRHAGRRIVLVTHAGVIHQALSLILQSPNDPLFMNGFFAIPNGAPTKMKVVEVPQGRKLWRLSYVGAPL
jgi:probable phosphoglycerate mutase